MKIIYLVCFLIIKYVYGEVEVKIEYEIYPKYINKTNYIIEFNNKTLIINLKLNFKLINSNNTCHFNGYILNYPNSYVSLSICDYFNKLVSKAFFILVKVIIISILF